MRREGRFSPPSPPHAQALAHAGRGGQALVIARSDSDEAIQSGLTATAGALDCFAEPVIGPRDFARVRWLAMTHASSFSRRGPHPDPPPRAGEGMGGGRSPSGALPRLSPSFQAWLSPVPRFMVATTCATRAASSSQTGVGAGRAGFRTARKWSYEPHPGHRSRSHQSAVTC